ncbi:integrin alpha-4-like [Centruroides sculpturatus]|uniref:integrin alpha-4-like n=1 Tax=Centruroides sculpturatus TaxID=218467 RepID=UPI000C6CA497|nr:integrin alpha-4-like [Centruroides sculpturatus]
MEKLLLFLFCTNVMSWNFETKTAITFKGHPGSYFGFSVAIHKNNQGIIPLITATKANSTGALYRCDINSRKCENVVLNHEMKINEIKKNMWLGVSLDVQKKENGHIVVCGHLWKLFIFVRDEEIYEHHLPLGTCYILNPEMTLVKRISPFEHEINNVTKFNFRRFSTAGVGISASFTYDENGLLIGSSGFNYFRGAVIRYKFLNNNFYVNTPSTFELHVQDFNTYIGYSVSSGKFFDAYGSIYVTGTPREGKYKGKVYTFDETYAIDRELEGFQIGEYFGAAILSVDVNNDGLTDLFVGAPLYSTKSGGDEGRVYIYLSDGKHLQYQSNLYGSSIKGSRFGTSLAHIGDINHDKFSDIAVGAPYELERGAIYIYHGSSNGIKSEFVQRIFAADVDRHLMGFGISISKPYDVDFNNYPDIVVGSYLSDDAVLLRTRPIVRIFPHMEFQPRQIYPNNSTCNLTTGLCFKAILCLRYEGSFVPATLDFTVELRAFRIKNELQPKEYFIDQNLPVSMKRDKITARYNENECHIYEVYIRDDSDDRITPIQINVDVYLTHNTTKETQFCKDCPILDPTFPHSKSKVITFLTGCAREDKCFSDLTLEAHVFGLSNGELILGKDKEITIIAEIQNFNEPAFMTEMWIYLPENMELINGENCKRLQEMSKELTLICLIGNPFDKKSARHEIKLDSSKLLYSLDNISIVMNLTTLSEESNLADNLVNITIPIKLSADFSITGRPEPELILLKKDESHRNLYEFVHIYNVMKHLYSPISLVTVTFSIPTTFTDTKIKFVNSKNLTIFNPDFEFDSVTCNFTNVETANDDSESDGLNFTISNIKSKRNSNNLISVDRSKNLILNCVTSVCENVVCSVGPFDDKKKSSTFYIKGYINAEVLSSNLKEWDNITFSSQGKLTIEEERIIVQSRSHLPHETEVSTNVVLSITLKSAKISKWVLPVSIVCGIIIIGIIVAILLKMGFFRRKRKEAVETLKANLLQQQSITNAENIDEN